MTETDRMALTDPKGSLIEWKATHARRSASNARWTRDSSWKLWSEKQWPRAGAVERQGESPGEAYNFTGHVMKGPRAEEAAVHYDPEVLTDGPSQARRTVVLAPGAGAGMDSPFMVFFATGLAGQGLHVVRFEFPYMANYRKTGKKRPPDRQQVLQESWHRVVEKLGSQGLVIGGKSMGGRIASLIADRAHVDGLICLGYPFHPPGKPNQLRVEHLRTITTPTLIVQGERDPFGSREEVSHYKLSSAVQLRWVEDGDHSFKPRQASGRTGEQNWQAALREIETFLTELAGH